MKKYAEMSVHPSRSSFIAPADTTLPDFKTLLEDLHTSGGSDQHTRSSEGLWSPDTCSPASSYSVMDFPCDMMENKDMFSDLLDFPRRDHDDDPLMGHTPDFIASTLDLDPSRHKSDRASSKYRIHRDPFSWSVEEVLRWLKSTVRRIGLSDSCIVESDWLMTGEELCRLPRYEFERRLQQDGEQVSTELEIWKSAWDMTRSRPLAHNLCGVFPDHPPSPLLPSTSSIFSSPFLHDSVYDDLDISAQSSYICLDSADISTAHYTHDPAPTVQDSHAFHQFISPSICAGIPPLEPLPPTPHLPYNISTDIDTVAPSQLTSSSSSLSSFPHIRHFNSVCSASSTGQPLPGLASYSYIINPQSDVQLSTGQTWKPKQITASLANQGPSYRYSLTPAELACSGLTGARLLLGNASMLGTSESEGRMGGVKVKVECKQDLFNEELKHEEMWMSDVVSSTQYLSGELDPKINETSRRWGNTQRFSCDRGKLSPEFPSSSTPGTSQSGSSRRGKRTICLWQFLKELLLMPQCQAWIRWLDQNRGIFKIEDSVRVARLWGERKNRPMMNYDKLSRSIRQYYRKGIIQKTSNSKRLVYQFCPQYI